ncbi:CP4-44 prophage; predicted disrupted hemin or colicin receptor [Escherichia coli]|uniref:CP4-44 prophage predicted disrupted hemin or colicin receptor n=1 Tax=Escherichia coli TaxID=562 RepID=A0A2X1NY93_ECOLX|nr:CP4-44 prophage; predicted disrupted hemin or colicin receptor [Escherichia coli]STM15781.1 CP4-44 prophage; predicted disrupted hemin or colicin receptor [Escherichia coli]
MRDITLRFDNREQFNAIVYDSGLFSLEEENGVLVDVWICPYISRHLLSLNPLQARCRRYSRGER